MTKRPVPPHRHPAGITRREVLQVGYSGLLGLGLPALAAAPAAAAPRRARSLIMVFLTGASSHLDTFDPKPDAPAEVRGPLRPLDTRVPGLRLSEHLPGLAGHAERLAVVRSLAHRNNNHLMATHHVLTGATMPGLPETVEIDKIASRGDWPCYAAALSSLRPRADGIPAGVNLPTFLVEGPLTWPGQNAGFLGTGHDPLQVRRNPNDADFQVESLRLPPGFSLERLHHRRALLAQVNRQRAGMDAFAAARGVNDHQQRALALLTSGSLAPAFELDREPAAVRDRYGRHMYGQSLLLARRLVEAGVAIVQCNMGIVQTWDTHSGNFTRLKDTLLPPLDRAVAALLEDLQARGMLEETMVVMTGEFGRTPRINKDAGRDHWADCFSAVFAGGGVRGGQVIGASDAEGAYPATTPYSPADLGATVYHALGIPPEAEIHDRQGRPMRLNQGRLIQPLYTGAGG